MRGGVVERDVNMGACPLFCLAFGGVVAPVPWGAQGCIMTPNSRSRTHDKKKKREGKEEQNSFLRRSLVVCFAFIWASPQARPRITPSVLFFVLARQCVWQHRIIIDEGVSTLSPARCSSPTPSLVREFGLSRKKHHPRASTRTASLLACPCPLPACIPIT